MNPLYSNDTISTDQGGDRIHTRFIVGLQNTPHCHNMNWQDHLSTLDSCGSHYRSSNTCRKRCVKTVVATAKQTVLEDYCELEARIETTSPGKPLPKRCQSILATNPSSGSYLESATKVLPQKVGILQLVILRKNIMFFSHDCFEAFSAPPVGSSALIRSRRYS